MTRQQTKKYRDKLKFILCMEGKTLQDYRDNSETCRKHCSCCVHEICPNKTIFFNKKTETIKIFTTPHRILTKDLKEPNETRGKNWQYICIEFLKEK